MPALLFSVPTEKTASGDLVFKSGRMKTKSGRQVFKSGDLVFKSGRLKTKSGDLMTKSGTLKTKSGDLVFSLFGMGWLVRCKNAVLCVGRGKGPSHGATKPRSHEGEGGEPSAVGFFGLTPGSGITIHQTVDSLPRPLSALSAPSAVNTLTAENAEPAEEG